MEFAVTGATGFMGSQLVTRLLDEGHTVNAVVREGGSNAVIDRLHSQRLNVVGYDGTMDSLVSAVENADYVIHLAALFTTKGDDASVKSLLKSNIEFSVNLFEAVRDFNPNAGIASASTFSAYDANGDYAPATVYAATKAAVETLAPAFGVKIAFLRLGDTFGTDDWRTKIPNLVRDAIKRNDTFNFMSPAEQKINLTHTDDVLDALIEAARQVGEETSPTVRSYDLFYPENELDLGEMADILNAGRNGSFVFPLFGKITELPPQKSLLPGFSPKRNPRTHLAMTVMGDE